MSASAFACLAALVAAAASSDDVRYIDASIPTEGRLLETAFADVDGRAGLELCRALLSPAGERSLAFHHMNKKGVDAAPFRVVPMLPDAIAFAFADVRAEPGDELVLLTKSGAYSYSLAHEGFRGNLTRLVALDLIYDVADPRELPQWEYVLRRAGGDWLLLPDANGYSIFGPSAKPDEGYVRVAGYAATRPSAAPLDDDERGNVRMGSGGFDIAAAVPSRFDLALPFVEEASARRRFLASERSIRAPALVDVDGDGLVDVVTRNERSLSVYLSRADAGDDERRPDRVEQLLESMRPKDATWEGVELSFADLDGDGLVDLLATAREESSGIGNVEVTLFALLNDGARLVPDTPSQVLRFEAADLRVFVADVDGDGRLDLGLRKFEMPSLLGTVAGVEFTFTHLLFLGQKGARPFERKPVLQQSKSYDENTIQDLFVGREWKLDCDGDGIADLVEVDIEGRVSVRRLVRDKSFFGGTTWSLSETPWARFETAGEALDVEVRDLNGDGLGDIVSATDRTLMLLLSSRVGDGE